RAQQKMNSSIFGFALDLVAGRVKGFENYKVVGPINFTHDIAPTEFAVTDDLFNAYRKYAVQKYRYTPTQVNNEREFVTRSLRTELVTAAYGSTTSLQVINEYDNQVMKAIEVLPQAKALAERGFEANRKATAVNTEDSGQ